MLTTEQRKALEALIERQDDTDHVMFKAGDMSTDVNEILQEQHVDVGVVEDLTREIVEDFWKP